jgi:hypothetical protein
MDQATGLDIIDQQFVPEGDAGHALFLAQRPWDCPVMPLG